MGKLWQKEYEVNKDIERFTVGEDYILDRNLIPADVAGNIAHARMLAKIGILTDEEFRKLKNALLEILKLVEGTFEIKPEHEDVHTAVENYLTDKLGDLGKKIHTARSRNDQVLLDLRLYMRDKLFELQEHILAIAEALADFAETYNAVPMPGRTHTQIAMPSSVGLWAGAYLEALLDDYKLVETAFELNDQSPLGSAASYGASIDIDREFVADELGFSKVQNNVLYVNNSRGKIESVVMSALAQVMLDLSKMVADLIFFSIPETRYFEIPAELCTGSSLMPQKKNPCGLELIRAKTSTVFSHLSNVLNIAKALPSGYNRDFQETKEPLMKSIDITLGSLAIAELTIRNLKVNEEMLKKGFIPEIFATDEVLKKVKEGVPFRDAYRDVAANLDTLEAVDPVENILSKKHTGATGNLGLGKSRAFIETKSEILSANLKKINGVMEKLLAV